MTSEELLTGLEQNRDTIKQLLAALEADYEMPEHEAKKADFAAAMGVASTAEKDVELSDEEYAAWLFEENAKGIAAAAKEAGARNVKSPATADESDGLDQVATLLGGGR